MNDIGLSVIDEDLFFHLGDDQVAACPNWP